MTKLDQLIISIDADTKPLKKSLAETESYTLKKSQKIGASFQRNFKSNIGSKIFDQGAGAFKSDLSKSLFPLAQRQQKISNPLGYWGDKTTTKMSRSILNKDFLNPLTSMLKNSIFGGIFGRQSGGKVNSKQPYLVGERGPEIFTPDHAGRVQHNALVKNGKVERAPINVTIQVNTPNVDSFKRSQSQILASMQNSLSKQYD